MKTLGLYIHIPFCKSKCGYCDFNSYAGKEGLIEPYFDALNNEIELMAKKYMGAVDTIYFGGGTPTSVDAKYICRTIYTIKNNFEHCSNIEITTECNPGTIDFNGLCKLYDGGINRLSIGLQSADNGCLKALGRIHTVEDFDKCFHNARRAGFNNISLDLMYGLPEQTMDNWTETLRSAVQFNPEHISAYALKIEDGTPFASKKLNLPDDDLVADMYQQAVQYLCDKGYGRYEISNFAKVGFESRHNLKYWKYNDFIGVGAGAFSCADGVRFSNVLDIEEYIESIKEQNSAEVYREDISDFDKMSEFVFLGLRLENGISEKEFKDRFYLNIDEVFGEQIDKYTKTEFLIRQNGQICFSDKGFFVSNIILADFV